jgi:hypothetical protein
VLVRRSGLDAMTEKAKKVCFVILPFAGEFEDVYVFGILTAAKKLGYICERIDQDALTAGPILQTIIRRLFDADLVVADLSESNPNIYYELGIVHALGTPLIAIARKSERIPFDLRDQPVLFYRQIRELATLLERRILAIEKGAPSTSPVLQAIPSLDRVPRSELTELKQRLKDVRSQLNAREQEVKALKRGSSQSTESSLIRNEITDFLQKLTDDVISKETDKLVSIRVELDKLKAENEKLRITEYELRKLEHMMIVNPRWSGRGFEVENDLCFLLMPFRESWSDDVWKLIKGVAVTCGFRCKRADEQDGRTVMDDIWEGICKAKVVVADLTAKNPNVTYEVGLADVLGKEVIILSQNPNDVPFDFLGLRLIPYENSIGGVRKLTEDLHKRFSKFADGIQNVPRGIMTDPSH